MMAARMFGLYAILDLPHAHGLVASQWFAAVCGGGEAIAACQLRWKGADTAARLEVLAVLGPLCAAVGVPLYVNDDLDAALAGVPGVVGVHLGQGDAGVDDVVGVRRRAVAAGRTEFRVGLSTHTPAQLRAAIAGGPDYVAYGPVAKTRSKADPDPVVGFEGLADACRISNVPVVAIGGLDVAGAARAIGVGAAMVAVIGGLVAASAEGTSVAARDYRQAIGAAAEPLGVAEVHARIPVISVETLELVARWADDLSVLAGLRLPARFRPSVEGGVVRYRPSDVCDLLTAIGKRDGESWADWNARGDLGDPSVVPLRLSR